jgi:hypothetical protein
VNSMLVVMMDNVSFLFPSFKFLFIELIDVHIQKRFDTNQIHCSQLLIHNQELKTKCDLLQEELDNLERNNIRLIQRWTQQVPTFAFFFERFYLFFY